MLEYNAWMVTEIAAITNNQKYLTLPGAYQVWNSNWPANERNDKIEATLKDFLSNEAMLSR
jgi:hypothetical protein